MKKGGGKKKGEGFSDENKAPTKKNEFLVEYKIKGKEEVHQVWMSEDSYNTLQWLIPLEYSKIIKTR